MVTIVERYMQKFKKSAQLYRQGEDTIPGGGHQSRVVHPFPHYVNEARGALKWDVDGNELVDYNMGFGALLIGHAHPVMVEAVSKQLAKGSHMGTPSELELRWAELIKDAMPTAERVRFTSSGTESTYLAIKLARAYTGKKMLIKFHEHYHGWHDYVSKSSGLNTQIGIPDETLSTVIVAQPDVAEVEQILENRDDIAAVIFEATGAHWGQFPLPNPKFVHDIRALTAKHGVVMIMDEVICGFRISRGGAQSRFDVKPDLTTMAKIVAGGLPGGAVAGRGDILDSISSPDETTRIPHPGTFNGNPISAAAGIAVLELIATEPINERADTMADLLKQSLRDSLTKLEVTGHVYGISSIVNLALGAECSCSGEICTLPHPELAASMHGDKTTLIKLAMLNEGVDTMGGIGFMLSSAHTENEVGRTVEAFERSLTALRNDGIL
ncbi:MAG: aminotransferase class III-fold pyridoxal phosphate-dependent enzyme [SAR202 cluster bacterium]|jgi:glutamate-1-semialdehyde 2,1-aminomutase|nr:aminotransferase class III-fold pyridoxal phosphate-dependent enzyme [SAR202 cluster bacterium]